ncbi:hypothetical protein ROZALSC1DRAFT_31021 [Rozella allomycis CSF55]|uniref:Uncharacterized protein n=1 Tax=Rozella allomycis (strain CSF55) TaxID=988480 RepID=A0A4P9YEZ7_ROZAC|nr:hypothetical protein ROZALSC1DRAFT_31021 [Rozella allomycis CSF55]
MFKCVFLACCLLATFVVCVKVEDYSNYPLIYELIRVENLKEWLTHKNEIESIFIKKSFVLNTLKAIAKVSKSGDEYEEYYGFLAKYHYDIFNVCNRVLESGLQVKSEASGDLEYSDEHLGKMICDNIFKFLVDPQKKSRNEILNEAVDKKLLNFLRYLFRQDKKDVMNTFNYAVETGKYDVAEAMIFDGNYYLQYKMQMLDNFKSDTQLVIKSWLTFRQVVQGRDSEFIARIMNIWDLDVNYFDRFFYDLEKMDVFVKLDTSRVPYWFNFVIKHKNVYFALNEIYIKRKESIPIERLAENDVVSLMSVCGLKCHDALFESAIKDEDQELLNFLLQKFNYSAKEEIIKKTIRGYLNDGRPSSILLDFENVPQDAQIIFKAIKEVDNDLNVFGKSVYIFINAVMQENFTFAFKIVSYFEEINIDRFMSIRLFFNTKTIALPDNLKYDETVSEFWKKLRGNTIPLYNHQSIFPGVVDWNRWLFTRTVTAEDAQVMFDILLVQKYFEYALVILQSLSSNINLDHQHLQIISSITDAPLLNGFVSELLIKGFYRFVWEEMVLTRKVSLEFDRLISLKRKDILQFLELVVEVTKYASGFIKLAMSTYIENGIEVPFAFKYETQENVNIIQQALAATQIHTPFSLPEQPPQTHPRQPQTSGASYSNVDLSPLSTSSSREVSSNIGSSSSPAPSNLASPSPTVKPLASLNADADKIFEIAKDKKKLSSAAKDMNVLFDFYYVDPSGTLVKYHLDWNTYRDRILSLDKRTKLFYNIRKNGLNVAEKEFLENEMKTKKRKLNNQAGSSNSNQ